MRWRRSRCCVALLLGLWSLPPLALAQEMPATVLQERQQRSQPVWGPRGMVAAGEPLAAAAGAAVLREGGNAVDAAVASSFALAVTLPGSTGLGGGGFLLQWLPGPSPTRLQGRAAACAEAAGRERRVGEGQALGLDFREAAAARSRPDQFQAPSGAVDRQRVTRSLQSAAVPGLVAGLLLAQRCYGRLPLRRVLAPAIRLAAEGVPVSRQLSQSLQAAATLLRADPTSRSLFFHADGQALQPGETLRQPALAATLTRIAAQGEAGFYRGATAAALLRLMAAADGLITADDLRSYRARPVTPLEIRFRGHPVLGLPPPAGGVTVLQLLRLLEPLDLAASGLNSAASLHLLVEAMNLVFQQRNARLGDPGGALFEAQSFLGERAIAALRRRIDRQRHRPAAELLKHSQVREGSDTTHLSVIDRESGMVALTSSINFAYGNGISVPAAGFLLNNHMDDFSSRPGSANAFGLVQGAANAIAPGRRPLSSMAPTLVFRPDGSPWIATGSPGGSRIGTTVVQVLLNRLLYGLNLASAVAEPRLHSQLLPDRVDLEQGFSLDTQRLLEERGHTLRPSAAMGAANSVEQLRAAEGGGSFGVTDPRRSWALAQPE
jgi:gamma-glutamyltranspeptidase/glutathione hydrolase